MTTFTIDNDNTITAFGTHEEAAAATTTPFDSFASQKELAELAAAWSTGRLVEVWNGFAGVAPFGDLKPVKKFTDHKTAVTRIWQAIQKLDEEVMRTRIRDAEAKLKDAPAQRSRCATGRPGRARQGPGDQEGHRRQERAQSQKSRQER